MLSCVRWFEGCCPYSCRLENRLEARMCTFLFPPALHQASKNQRTLLRLLLTTPLTYQHFQCDLIPASSPAVLPVPAEIPVLVHLSIPALSTCHVEVPSPGALSPLVSAVVLPQFPPHTSFFLRLLPDPVSVDAWMLSLGSLVCFPPHRSAVLSPPLSLEGATPSATLSLSPAFRSLISGPVCAFLTVF